MGVAAPSSKAVKRRRNCNRHWSLWLTLEALTYYHWVLPLPGSPSWSLLRDPDTAPNPAETRNLGPALGGLIQPHLWDLGALGVASTTT